MPTNFGGNGDTCGSDIDPNRRIVTERTERFRKAHQAAISTESGLTAVKHAIDVDLSECRDTDRQHGLCCLTARMGHSRCSLGVCEPPFLCQDAEEVLYSFLSGDGR